MIKKFFQEPSPVQIFLLILCVNSIIGFGTGTLLGAVVGTVIGVLAGPIGSWILGLVLMLIEYSTHC